MTSLNMTDLFDCRVSQSPREIPWQRARHTRRSDSMRPQRLIWPL